jgi:quercetin dioxygenase-like cupin family protein
MSSTDAAAKTRRIYNPIQHDAATFLETSAESDGRHTLIEVELAPGGGNTLHRHLAFDERFRALDGTLTVRIGNREERLETGEVACAPIGAVHCFSNRTDEPVRIRVELLPGHTGFEQSLQIAYGLAEDGLARANGIPKRLAHLALLVQMGDTRLPGAMRMLEPVLRLIARRARRRGVEAELVERYCRF